MGTEQPEIINKSVEGFKPVEGIEPINEASIPVHKDVGPMSLPSKEATNQIQEASKSFEKSSEVISKDKQIIPEKDSFSGVLLDKTGGNYSVDIRVTA